MRRFAATLVLCVAAACVVPHLTASVFAQSEPPAAGAPAAADPDSDAADPWGFEDEEDAIPTWAESFQAQAVDVGAFVAYATLVMVSFFRKSERLKVVTLVASVLYLGFYKGTLMSIVDIFRLINWNVPIVRENLAWYAFAIFFIVIMLLWGRLYCGRVCAFGSLTQLMDKIVPAKWRITIPRPIEQRANYIKYGMLAFVVVYYLMTRDPLIYRFTEPFWMFTRQGLPVMWVGLAVLLTATVFVRNLYCRFLCPLGAFIALVSTVSAFRIPRWSECNTCKICEKTCEWGAIRGPKIVVTECVRCDDCEVLYANKKKCPHWLIIQRKEDVLARQRAVST
ncbi:MAG: 4Fe-4S binding protein [Vicinamibacterales bacterium]